MFKIIITGYNCEKYISKCLYSVTTQEETDWEACVILDPVTDKTFEIAKKWESEKLKVYMNTERIYATGNSVECVRKMNCKDDDILVWLDADDWFYDNHSLKIVKSYYSENPNLLLTHGSWIAYPNPNIQTNNGSYKPEDFQNNGIRNLSLGNWRASHTKTMKYVLFRNIKESDLKDSNGKWLKSAYDTSFFFPALEMAGFNRIQYIPEITYVYNRETQYNDDKVNTSLQEQCTIYNSKLKPYSLI